MNGINTGASHLQFTEFQNNPSDNSILNKKDHLDFMNDLGNGITDEMNVTLNGKH